MRALLKIFCLNTERLNMAQISVANIFRHSKATLLKFGAIDWIADAVAEAIAKSESVGNRICGLYYLESYCLQLQSGRVKGDVEPIVSQERGGIVRVDAQFGFAQPAFQRGLASACLAAVENGICSLAIGRAHTCTSLGYFTEQIAKKNLIGIGFTNASPIVAPPGGKSRIIGTNPIAFSVPDGNCKTAIHFDQSTTAVALGKITMAKAAGEKIPVGWALDKNGKPTTDAAAALQGSLVSSGGYKGWGFGLMAEVLAAGIAGGLASQFVQPLKATNGEPHNLGQYYILIDPQKSNSFENLLNDLKAAVSQDKGTRLPGQGKVEEEFVAVPNDLLALLEQLSGTDWKD